METQLRKLAELRMELVNANRAWAKSSHNGVKKTESDILNEMGIVIDNMENLIYGLEKENCEYNDFDKAVEPAIRYLLKNHNPHTKIFIDYSNAELLSGEKTHYLNKEIPD